jgi:hypothetical protein
LCARQESQPVRGPGIKHQELGSSIAQRFGSGPAPVVILKANQYQPYQRHQPYQKVFERPGDKTNDEVKEEI